MLDQRYSDNEPSKRDVPSFIEPRPPLIQNPFMRPRPQKATNLLELFEEDSEVEEPELVQVYLRLKPCNVPNNLYEVRSDRCLVTSMDTTTAGHGRRTQHNVSKMYTFSRIFGPECNQKEVFEQVVKQNLKKLPDGHNFTLLTYGASGSGKTYTLMGTVSSPGLVPRSLEYVFRLVDAAQQPLYKPSDGGADKLGCARQDLELQWIKRLQQVSAPARDKYRRMSAQLHRDLTASTIDLSYRPRHYVWVSFVEIYNEAIYDLLAPPDKRNKLRIREDTTGNVYVKGVTQAFVRSGEEAYDVMVAGKHNLVVAATGVHAQSSRSHCIFTITMLTETDGEIRTSCIRLCDLAGCERARATRNTGARMQESRAINSSLHVLERCLHMLRRKQRQRQEALVPYRESKLTRLLGSGLSGSRGEAVSMVVTLNPSPQYAHETKHVLTLAAVAQDIQINNTVLGQHLESTINSSTRDTIISASSEVMKLRADNERLHFELVQAQSRNKELMAAMEERQQETANTMKELVEEAKDLTRQFYEAQINSLRTEMEEMEEEYESRLAKNLAPSTDSGTPSRNITYLQNKVAELMTEITVLEEKLSAESLARVRAEKELQHLRTCIDERDEKAFKDNSSGNQEVVDLSDSEHEEEDADDPFNESLEPVFKKEELNRSHLHSDQQTSYDTEHTIDNIEEETDLDKSNDTLRNDSDDTAKDSTYATGDDESKVNKNKDICDSVTYHSFAKYDKMIDNDIIDELYITNQINNADDENVTNKPCQLRGTYFVKDDQPQKCFNEEFKKLDITRGTYFIRDSESEISDKITKTDVKAEINEIFESKTKDTNKIRKVSETLVSKIIKSLKTSQESDSSLRQFEQLEIAANTRHDDSELKTDDFGNIKMLKEKRTYLFHNATKDVSDDLTNTKVSKVKPTYFENDIKKNDPDDFAIAKLNKEKRKYFDNIDVNVETANNKKFTELKINSKAAENRLLSIVKDDMGSDSGPSTIKKLLGDTFAKPDLLSSIVNKVHLKKHDSVDIFEGFDSPHFSVKAKEATNAEIGSYSIDKLVEQKVNTTNIPNIAHAVKDRFVSSSDKTQSKQETSKVNDIIKKFDSCNFSPKVSQPVKLGNVCESIDKLVLDQKANKIKVPDVKIEIKFESSSVDEPTEKPAMDLANTEHAIELQTSKINNTIDDFENIYKDVTAPRATEFDLLVTQEINVSDVKKNDIKPEQEIIQSKYEESKYNLRNKKHEVEEILAESHAKSECKPKPTNRNLRLRRRKCQNDDEINQENDKLKDIVNLKAEFSDVTMDVPALKKDVKDIPSPEKRSEEDENLPPMMGIQSCPSKSVTRSRRKLFTPRAEPLEESLTQTGDSNERIYVPRPSYHRARARRKL